MSTAAQSLRVRPRLVVLIGVFVLLAWAANASVLAFDQFGYATRAVVVLTIAVVSVPMGALGFLVMLASLSAGLDGEWLGEGWPIFEAMFFWSIAVCIYALPDLAQVRSGRTSRVSAGEPLSRAG